MFVLYSKLALADSYYVDQSHFPLIRTSPLTRLAINKQLKSQVDVENINQKESSDKNLDVNVVSLCLY